MPTSLILNKKFKIESIAKGKCLEYPKSLPLLSQRARAEYENFHKSDPIYKTLSEIFSDYTAPKSSGNKNHYVIKQAANLLYWNDYNNDAAFLDLSLCVTDSLKIKIYNTSDLKQDHPVKLNMICNNVVFVNKENENDIVLFKLMQIEITGDCKWIDVEHQYSIENGEISLLTDEAELRENFNSFWDFAKYIRLEGRR